MYVLGIQQYVKQNRMKFVVIVILLASDMVGFYISFKKVKRTSVGS